MRKYLLLSLIPGIGMLLLSIGLPNLFESSVVSPRLILWAGIFFIIVPPIFSFWPKPKDKKIYGTHSNKESIQSIVNDTYSLYNETGLFVKYCYLEERGNRLVKLNDSFDSYLKNIKGKLALVPQELELKTLRLFDILSDYKRSAEIIYSATKTNNRYTDQQELEKKFANEVSPLYAEIEVELRKILNNLTQSVA
ncbi:MAG: hypothetical protein K9K86_07145 [Pseudomonadales bacterium]|nr:hypothetical protein [Pseudomonadales bacterium]